jgi:hypothetical protein
VNKFVHDLPAYQFCSFTSTHTCHSSHHSSLVRMMRTYDPSKFSTGASTFSLVLIGHLQRLMDFHSTFFLYCKCFTVTHDPILGKSLPPVCDKCRFANKTLSFE